MNTQLRTFCLALPYQVFRIGQAVTIKLLLAAVTKTVKLITKMNDVVVTFFIVDQSKDSTSANTSTVLQIRDSKSVVALKRLNSVSDKMFSSNVSMFLGAPVTVKSTIWTSIYSDFSLDSEIMSRKKKESYTIFASKYNRISFLIIYL